MRRYQCNYCRRIVTMESDKAIPCQSCGHGMMKKQKPKTFCSDCGKPIYKNVDTKRKLTCADCTNTRIAYYMNKGMAMGKTIKKARQEHGWSQRTFALAMECSQSLIKLIEKGERIPTKKIQDFLLKNSQTVSD
jgi:ribosome-binding protein aMBF1 (putative translation factor)